MKVLATSNKNIYHCQGCEALLQYEEEDIQYVDTGWKEHGNTGKMMRERTSYIECPICHSQLEFYNFVEWKRKEDEDECLVHFTNKYYGKEYSEAIHKV